MLFRVSSSSKRSMRSMCRMARSCAGVGSGSGWGRGQARDPQQEVRRRGPRPPQRERRRGQLARWEGPWACSWSLGVSLVALAAAFPEEPPQRVSHHSAKALAQRRRAVRRQEPPPRSASCFAALRPCFSCHFNLLRSSEQLSACRPGRCRS